MGLCIQQDNREDAKFQEQVAVSLVFLQKIRDNIIYVVAVQIYVILLYQK